MVHVRLLLALLCGYYVGYAYAACISTGDQFTITKLFQSGGAGAVVSLCASSNFTISGTINFTAPNQELSTAGYPTGSTRATITVTGANVATAIFGKGISGIKIRNIQVNGNRPALGKVNGGDALISIGGTGSQVVDHCHLYEPRGWSCLHIMEGGCTGASITNNNVGPSGTSDGNWADGISMACTNSLVQNNVITDATDGAIVIFGAPGTRVVGNTIIANTRVLLGGINMVDYGPYNGDYTGVVVTGNTINAAQVQIKTAIAIGPGVWGSSNTSLFNYGGTVYGNTITGNYMAYGIPVQGAKNFNITGNTSTAKYSGAFVQNCPNPQNAPPSAFVYNPALVIGSSLQSNFVPGRVLYAICVQPGASASYSYQPGQLLLQNGGPNIQLQNASIVQQGDGNLVMYTSGGSPLWASNTAGHTCANLACVTQFNSLGQITVGNSTTVFTKFPPVYSANLGSSTLKISEVQPFMQLSDSNNNIVWASSYYFVLGFSLAPGQFVVQSSGTTLYYLTLSSSANLVVSQNSVGGTVLWTTNVSGKTCTTSNNCFLSLQGDGNMVIYTGGSAVWASGTNGATPGYALTFSTSSPYLTLVTFSGVVQWHSS